MTTSDRRDRDRRACVYLHLPLSPRRAMTVRLKSIFGALRDVSPDAWGRRIIEKHTGRAELNEVDYLLHSPQDRAGALSSRWPPNAQSAQRCIAFGP